MNIHLFPTILYYLAFVRSFAKLDSFGYWYGFEGKMFVMNPCIIEAWVYKNETESKFILPRPIPNTLFGATKLKTDFFQPRIKRQYSEQKANFNWEIYFFCCLCIHQYVWWSLVIRCQGLHLDLFFEMKHLKRVYKRFKIIWFILDLIEKGKSLHSMCD